MYRQDWEGHPRTKPSVAARTVGGATTVYASWNGATEVAAWRVLAGPSAAQLAPSAQAPRMGFETAVAVPGVPPVVAVQALDAKGRVLATSRPVGVVGG
jgi:subtilisin family serine protease